MDSLRPPVSEAATQRPGLLAFAGGAVIGALGGLIGLGGAEFRLPLLIGAFQFAGLEAVIVNKAMSLVVVASALPFRAATVPFTDIGSAVMKMLADTRGIRIGDAVGYAISPVRFGRAGTQAARGSRRNAEHGATKDSLPTPVMTRLMKVSSGADRSAR